MVGATIVVLEARRSLPGDGGHSPLDGIGGKPTPISHAPGVALAALASLAFGAVIGPEAPLIALGSVVGLLVTRFVTVDPTHHNVLAMAGSFSAISALFGGPVVAGMLLIETGVGLGRPPDPGAPARGSWRRRSAISSSSAWATGGRHWADERSSDP